MKYSLVHICNVSSSQNDHTHIFFSNSGDHDPGYEIDSGVNNYMWDIDKFIYII